MYWLRAITLIVDFMGFSGGFTYFLGGRNIWNLRFYFQYVTITVSSLVSLTGSDGTLFAHRCRVIKDAPKKGFFQK
jgi:hypothetical protein